MSDLNHLRWMLGFLRPVRSLAIWAVVWLALWTGVEILVVRTNADAINAIEAVRNGAAIGSPYDWLAGRTPEAARVMQVVIGLATLSVALGVLSFLREVSSARLSMNKVFFIREAIYDKLQRVGLHFHDRISTGELINRALVDLQNVRNFVNTSVLLTSEIILIVGGYMILLLTRSPWAALLAVLPLPIWAWYTIGFARRVRPAQRAASSASDETVRVLTENLAGVHVVKAFATQPQEIGKFNASCEAWKSAVLRRIRMFANYIPTIRAISMLSHLSLFLLAGVLIIRGRLKPGDILMLGSAMGAILMRLQQIATISEQYQDAIVSSQRLRDVLDAESTVAQDAAAGELPPGGAGAVRFEHVTFGYDPAKPVLHDVSFEAPAGSVVAIVGPTGSGKTTLVQLIARLYDPQHGRVLIDGADLRGVSLDALRREVAFVFQETYLFSDSVSGNIAYGRPATGPIDVESVSRLAQAHEFVETLPSAYAAAVGERGVNLSGGQRQRLAIARALFTSPRILVLDDATASVDPQTEELIHGGLRSYLEGRTLFVVAHRLSTVRHADVVIVLEGGRITQFGTHDELLQRDGHYREIAALQLYGDEQLGSDGLPHSMLKRNRTESHESHASA